MSRVVVLGAGMVGGAMAADLAGSHQVVSVDRDAQRLAWLAGGYGVQTRVADLSQAEVVAGRHRRGPCRGCGAWFHGLRDRPDRDRGRQEYRRHLLLRRRPVRAGCFGARARRHRSGRLRRGAGLEQHDAGLPCQPGRSPSYRCLVGGLPVKRIWPWQYKAPFSPVDVLEEYTQPHALGRGRLYRYTAGPLRARIRRPGPRRHARGLNTDGLRSLLVADAPGPRHGRKLCDTPATSTTSACSARAASWALNRSMSAALRYARSIWRPRCCSTLAAGAGRARVYDYGRGGL